MIVTNAISLCVFKEDGSVWKTQKFWITFCIDLFSANMMWPETTEKVSFILPLLERIPRSVKVVFTGMAFTWSRPICQRACPVGEVEQ